MRVPIRGVVVLTAATLLAGGCSSDEKTAPEDGGGSETFDFGAPADSADADRVIEITADDDFTFDPDDIVVTVGETVTFRVTNRGKLPHEFTLGDEEAQMEHEMEMTDSGGMDNMANDPNAIAVPSGQTVDLTWMFSKEGAIIGGCHTQGHYDAGMLADIRVEPA